MSRVTLRRELTARQLQVVLLVADGHRVRSIAKALSLREKTVDRHITLIARKIPGTLPAMSKIRVWWAEGGAATLGVSQR